MITAHLFNPDNDLALAANSVAFTPPPRVSAMIRQGAALPLWWADPGDIIIGTSDDDLRWAERQYGLTSNPVASPLHCSPWGWSREAVRRFRSAGIAADILPDDSAIQAIRALSHRRSSIMLLRALGQEPPLEVTDIARVVESDIVVKSPWSSSGKGVLFAAMMPRKALLSQARGMIRRQGSVIIEPRRDCLLNFSALFGDNLSFLGFSLFDIDAGGRYGGNLVLSQSAVCEAIEQYAPLPDMNVIANALQAIVGSAYSGPIGIDMMIYRDRDGLARLWPCVEVNLRRTMGHVVLALWQHLGISGRLGYGMLPNGTLPLTNPDRGSVFFLSKTL